MKRFLIVLLALTMIFSLAACSGDNDNPNASSSSDIDVSAPPSSNSDIDIAEGEQNWPIDTFFFMLPNASDKVDEVIINEDQTVYNLMKTEMTYDAYAAYIKAMEAEGFVCDKPVGLEGIQPADGFASWSATKDGITVDAIWTTDESTFRNTEYDFTVSFSQQAA